MADLTRIVICGKAYLAALDPGATSVPDESGWPRPTFQRRGRGTQAVYELTDSQALDMADHLDTLAECFLTGSSAADDPDSRAEGRACERMAHRIRTALDPRP